MMASFAASLVAAFISSIWLWLYAISGVLIRIGRRSEVILNWFTRRFDIEKKPLRALGLVAGALAALPYFEAPTAKSVKNMTREL